VSSPNRSSPALLEAAVVVVTVGSLILLLAWDMSPASFGARAHDMLGAVPLGAVAVVCILQPLVRRASRMELLKSALLAAAFLFWAANQLWPDAPRATLFNDLAIALFVADIVVPWGT
jgi:hypothetical protein